jgi:hypothetical protein
MRFAFLIVSLRMHGTVIALIPAARTNIPSTEECEVTIHHDKFLVMTGAEGVAVVEAKL